MKSNRVLIEWLFTPFKFLAGMKALIIGLIVMVVLSVLGYLSETHFDGALDIHYGCSTVDSVYLTHALYQLLAWGTMTIIFYLTARVVTKTAIRLIDMAGTIALSQLPLIFAALLGFIPSFHLCFGDLDTTNIADVMAMLQDNIVVLIVCSVVTMIFVIWSIVLKYNAYSVSANLKGVAGGVSFTIALIIAEIVSKILIYILL
ncbi:hypothetical protein JGH11_16700 [Dysgonomonas sp. Marseille-P4677]|uniref:YIP1 family protein n=1 Tax=Dysgonomonas sp. Marseille-P4677 TaxID=2364790 RepID=UPI0019137601|nr:YIP1 family protein [Dysgonomonas sp. Marseille-P4677]MBK5722515.1 hypothetical protein [Dysgonomonas sp. Marseille-P4677]